MSTAGSSSSTHTYSNSNSSSPRDNWRPVVDPHERRRIQNRLAQRKYRDKVRIQREADTRREYDERMAGTAYAPPDPAEMGYGQESGLPWGSFSLRYIIETGRARAQHAQEQPFNQHPSQGMAVSQHQTHHPQHQHQHPQQALFPGTPYTHSRHSSPFLPLPPQVSQYRYDHGVAPRSNAPSSVGLHLVNDYARGYPYWQAWRGHMPSGPTTQHASSSVTTDSSMVSDCS